MKLTRSVGYAVGILLQMTSDSTGETLTAARISRGCKFPPRFLYRVLRRLVDAGLLTGVSGPHGGYGLARPARQINLLEIVQAVEETADGGTLLAASPKHRAAIAKINAINDKHSARFERELAKVKLSQLASGQRKRRR